MKQFKFFLAVMILLSATLFCNKIYAGTRIAVREIFPDPITGNYYKVMMKYKKMLIKQLSETGKFELVDFNDISTEYFMKHTRSNNPDMDIKNMGHWGRFRYIVGGTLKTEVNSAKEIVATVYLSLYDTKRPIEAGQDVIAASGTGIIPLSSGKKKSASKPSEALKDKAAEEALTQAVQRLIENIAGDFITVAKIDAENGIIVINKGSSSKIKAGEFYKVQTEVADGTDEFLGAEDTRTVDLALIKIKEVQSESATAEVVKDRGNINVIREGDKLRGISSYELDVLDNVAVSNMRTLFPEKRPESKKSELNLPAKKQAVKAESESLPPLPAGVTRIGIVKFDSKTPDVLDKEAAAITDLCSRLLANSDKIAVLERDRLAAIAREHKLNLSGIIDPSTAAQVGKLAGCQYILMGSITEAQEDASSAGHYITSNVGTNYTYNYNSKAGQILAGLELLGDVLEMFEQRKDNVVTETYEMTAAIDARLVNVETGEIATAFTAIGSAAQTQTLTQDKDGYMKSSEVNYGGLQNQAVASAAANLGNKVREEITGEHIQISSINGDEIIINRGSASGVQNGDLFCIYPDGKSPADTEAIISVNDVQDAFSVAELVSVTTASYSATVGSRAEPVLHRDFQKGIWHIKNQKRAEAKDISKNKKKLENASTEAKKVIKSYGLSPKNEKSLLDAHAKAAKISNTKKKYEAYVNLSNADMNDYLASYNAGKCAFDLSLYTQAGEFAEKALHVNPNYKPAKDLIEKVNGAQK